MKITGIKTVLLTGPCTNDPFLLECRKFRSAAFIEVHTDVGVVGLGETYAGYFCPEIVPEIVRFFEPIAVGQNVDDIDALWKRMYHCGNFWCRTGLGLIVLAGIDAALWDLKGRLEHLPVWKLLGGERRAPLDCYATGGPSNYPKPRLAEKIEFYMSQGFRACKLGTGVLTKGQYSGPVEPRAAAELEADKLEFVRSRFGHDVRVMLDGHMGNCQDEAGTWGLDTAVAVAKAIEPYDVFFLEEPLHYNNVTGYAELCKQSKVPIAGGECLTGDMEWDNYIERDAFDIGQPDASYTGGMTLMRGIADRLHARGKKIATHAWGAGASLMQNVHVGFACANTAILEIAPAYGPLHSEVIGDSLQVRDGKVVQPHTVGLGVTLSDQTKNRFPFIPGSGEFNPVPGKDTLDAFATAST